MSSMVPKGKPKIKPKKYHGYNAMLWIFGTLFPPLAVAARFGIGKDFWLNLLLTVCGYIPGHVHNFYIQNIRNNKTHQRTPKWVQRYGLVDTTKLERNAKRSQWATRYNERLPNSALEGQDYEEGETSGSRENVNGDAGAPKRPGARDALWREEDESYYGQNGESGSTRSSESGGRWHYPANFNDALPPTEYGSGGGGGKKKKSKKDRWARTEDAYSLPDDGGRKKKKKRKGRSTVGEGGDGDASSYRTNSTSEFPEDAEGGLYGDRPTRNPPAEPNSRQEDELNHEF
ncbi:hypothetical protein BD410DRAFT_762461 [Rickenella mellea]|uniref:Uncharacterized protein n=1 Tax=Rickenella mellea TaxID=50990 RepID=A0A4Y7QIL7_9AGAM|nr:hypothetical protein BD410DRAFT_762461 [Rickenella mellea]